MYTHLLYILLYIALSRSEDLLMKDSGVGCIDEDDIAMIFYVTLENKSEKDFEVSVSMAQCCDTTNPNEMDCNSMSLIGGDMGVLYAKYIKNVTLIYPNLFLMNRQGQCTVNVRYRNEGTVRQKMSRINFNTVVPNEEGCECPSLDMDSTQNCRPVDCVIKYSGMRNYFDSKRMGCVSVTKCLSPPDQCVPEIGYSIPANNCTNLNNTIGKDDLHLLDSNISQINECMTTPLGYTICHHGSTDSGGLCECDTGWITTTDEEIYSPSLLLYHMCNVEVGAWNCLNRGRIRTTTILIAIFAITIASKILILMCILNWCYKRYRNKKELICSDTLDPNRDEIILCEELQQFDDCLCDEKPKKSHFLETQTVNVSYYPCMPSAFSSFCGSLASNKCKCSPNSEESIVLSKTTTSPHESFVSDSDVATDATEQMEEEGNGDMELSGEGEEYSDMDEEGVKGGESYRDKSGVEDGEEELYDEFGEQTDYTGYSGYASRRSTSSKTKSMSTARRSRSSAYTK